MTKHFDCIPDLISSDQSRWEEYTKVLSCRDIQHVMGTPWR